MQTVQTCTIEQSSVVYQLDSSSFILGFVGAFLFVGIMFLLITLAKDCFEHFSNLYFPRQCFTREEKRDNFIYQLGFDKGKIAKPGEECPIYHQLPKDKTT